MGAIGTAGTGGITGATPLRVFLSHTSDLGKPDEPGSFVAAAVEAVLRARHAVTDMAYFAARDSSPAAVCVDMVAQSDLYVGIIGLQYGSPVRDRPDLSYTELEFKAAGDLGQPCLIFLISEDSGNCRPPTSRLSAGPDRTRSGAGCGLRVGQRPRQHAGRPRARGLPGARRVGADAERALAIWERVVGPDHLDLAFRLHGLARLLRAQGELQAARPLFERAVAIRERVLGSDHPHTAISLGDLALMHWDQGELDAARPLFERVLGPDHPDTVATRRALAELAGEDRG
ncbi:MAG: tetratricopeptide repeat protein [Chloroflexi bacterium]|nr:MAG: tetratricopeptide repeat protein [Chloroflexota bacterium]